MLILFEMQENTFSEYNKMMIILKLIYLFIS